MRCLWLARMIPSSLNDGAAIYSAGLSGALADAGAEVTVIGLGEPGAAHAALSSKVDWRPVAARERSTLGSLLDRHPLVAARYAVPAFARAIRTALEAPWDAVVLDHYAMVWTLPLLKQARHYGLRSKRIYVAHNAETEVSKAIARAYAGNPMRRGALWLNAAKTAAAERDLARHCDLVSTLTQEDADAFRRLRTNLRTVICPPGFERPASTARDVGQTPRRVCIVGSYHWMAKQMNLEAFLTEADNRFAAAAVELDIIGDAPPEFRARVEKRLKAARFVGFAPDLDAAIAQQRMGLVVEQTGGGFKLKVLDYIFRRLPVAALEGSFRGVPDAVARNFIVAPDAAALADAVIAHIDDVEGLNRRQEQAWTAASGLYDWKAIGRRLFEAIEGIDG